MKRFILNISLFTSLCLPAVAQVSTQNYIQTRTYLDESGTKYLDEIQYIDGLGRPFQTVQKRITPALTHLVTLQQYDNAGRESRLWLPHVSSSDYIDPATLRSQVPSTYAHDTRPYTQTDYESSPQNRVSKIYGPGKDWSTKAIATDYLTNTASGELACKLYTVTGTGGISTTGNYAANELYVIKTTDEDGRVTYSFTDKLDREILTRQMNGNTMHDTYYVYDDLSRLRFVLSPMYQDNANLNLYAYQYTYDARGRCTEKRLPGCAPIRYVYDLADRLIFSQDGNQEAKTVKEWTFYLYDTLGREVLRGTCTNMNTSSIASTVVTTSFTATNSGIGNSGYTSSFSLANPVVERICYYDTYKFRALTGFTNATHFPAETVNATGLLTGQVHIPFGTTNRLCEAFYYDRKGRLLNHVAGNHLGGYDKTITSYSFTGQPLTVTQTHTATGKTTQTEVYTYTYDHAERLTKVTHKLNSNAAVTLAEQTYDNLGRLKSKINHATTVNQSGYTYNIRDWITNIGGRNFAQNLYYNTGSANNKQYGGNINIMTWKAGTESAWHGYYFYYDGLNRLTDARYADGSTLTTNNRFDERVTQYDKNGNIKKLERRGKTLATAYGLIDNLTFIHHGNQLLNVSDAASGPTYAGNFNFVDGNKGTGTEYVWDKNGNLVQDYNKQIANISYNSLNLPSKLQFRQGHTAEYLYDASGIKRQVKHTTTNQNLSVGWGSFKNITAAQKASEKVTDYCGNVIYENGVLSRIHTPEGYITLSGNTPTYHYYVRDHLGNNRVVVNQNGTVEQVNHYYPFGGLFGEGTATTDQPYKYNDKELDRTNGLDLYDYSARYMDAALGQFTTMDPMAEKYYSISPYAYVGNNPVKRIDPDGMDWYEDENGNVRWQEGSEEIEGYINIGSSVSLQTSENSYINFYQNAGIQANQAVNAFDLISASPKLQKQLLGKNSVLSDQSQSKLFNALNQKGVEAFARPIGEAIVEYGAGALLGGAIGKSISYAWGNFSTKMATESFKKSNWVYGNFKSQAKWANQFSKRGWTAKQVTEAIAKGKSFEATNLVNKANGATRYVHPTTGKSVVIDNVTREILHVGGPGFKY